MEILLYILFLLVIMNFYLKFRRRDAITSTQRFMLSFMSIALVFVVYTIVAKLLLVNKISMDIQSLTPTLLWTFTLAMAIVMPLVAAEIVLQVYSYVLLRKAK